MELTLAQLEAILESLPPDQWLNPYIETWNDEYRLQHNLFATQASTGKLFYYEEDSQEFEPLGI